MIVVYILAALCIPAAIGALWFGWGVPSEQNPFLDEFRTWWGL